MKSKSFFSVAVILGLIISCSPKKAVVLASPTASTHPSKLMGTCKRCHGLEWGGVGKTPSLIHTAMSREQILDILRNGKNRMPAFASNYTPSELEAITDYILTLKQGEK